MSNNNKTSINVAYCITTCDNRGVGNAAPQSSPIFLLIIQMYTSSKQQKQSDQHSDENPFSVRVELAQFVGGPRITLRGFLDKIAPHYPHKGAVFPYWNPIFQHLQVLGHDLLVDHAHVREMDVVGKRRTIERLRDCVKSVCEFNAKVGTYWKEDEETGTRYMDYRFTEVEGVITVSEEEQYDYENWCWQMGHLTPPSTHGVFSNPTDKGDDLRYDY